MDDQGFSAELLFVDPSVDAALGFLPSAAGA
jgi:hypothetical protein